MADYMSTEIITVVKLKCWRRQHFTANTTCCTYSRTTKTFL